MYIIGIDIGTSSTKAVALDETGKVLLTAQVPYPTLNSIPGVAEQDADVVWQAFLGCIKRIVNSLSLPPEAIALSSAMHSVLCVDDSGQPISNLITWADNRSSEVAARVKNSSIARKLYHETGTPIHAMSPLCKLIWLRETNEELFNRSSRFISIKEYVWSRIFSLYEIDYSIASATGLFNIQTLRWHEEALGLVRLNESKLSVPVNTNFSRALPDEFAVELNVTRGTKIFIGGSDGCLANAGSFATEPGIAALTIGTSGAIRVAGASPVLNFDNMPFNYRLDEKTFISGGPINNGGIALKWYGEKLLKKPLRTSEDYDELLNALENVPPGSNYLVFLPYLQGERAPIWNSDTCGVFFGITTQHTQAHFTKAVIEGIVFSLYQIARSLEDHGLEIKRVHVSGGFVRSNSWVQLLADIFGKQISLLNVEDASAIGAALIAFDSLGINNSIKEVAEKDILNFEPDFHKHALYKERFFPMYEHLYKSLMLEMKIFHENQREVDPETQLNS